MPDSAPSPAAPPPDDSSQPRPPGKSEAAPYELEPAPEPAPVPSPSRLSDKGLTDDFPEDADFSHDPEVEEALHGKKDKPRSKDETVDEETKPQPPLVKPGLGDAKTISLVGAGLAIAAVVAAGVEAETHRFWQAILALYLIIVHSLTGLGAVATTAHLNDQPVGPPELAAGRMLAAVSMFMLLLNIHVTSYPLVGAVFATGGYYLVLAILFRAPAARLLMIAIIHALTVILLWLGMSLYGWATAAPVKAG
jgi:hypothetical protein